MQLQLNAKDLSGKVAIFDFGGVISKTLFETHALTEKALALKSGTLTWQGPFDPSTDPLWVSMQNGEISERDYWKKRTLEVAHLVGENWQSMQEFVIAARAAEPAAAIRDEALTALSLLKGAGCRLAILSNELDLFYGADFRKKLPFMADFEVIVDATYSKILKPDARAYQLCLDELGARKEHCLFIDDQAGNIQGANEFGIATVHFNVCSPLASYQELLTKMTFL